MTTVPFSYQDGLETERLRTRFLSPDDVAPWTQFFRDKEAVALFPDFGLKSEEARARHWIEKQLGRYAANTLGHQALIHKETGAFIGQSGLLLQEVDGRQEIDVGYHIFKKYWGQGYAPEAARTFMAYGFEQEGVDSIISIIDTRNTNSQRVAEKNGLQREKETSWSGLRVYVYRIHKADWKLRGGGVV